MTVTLVNNILQALRSECIVADEIEMPAWLGDPAEAPSSGRCMVAFTNGLLDLDDQLAGGAKGLRPHTPVWFSATIFPYAFDPEADCPRWKAFMKEFMDRGSDRIDLLQEWTGYNLAMDTTQQKFLMLEGEGNNGKGVYLAGLTAILCTSSVTIWPALISPSWTAACASSAPQTPERSGGLWPPRAGCTTR